MIIDSIIILCITVVLYILMIFFSRKLNYFEKENSFIIKENKVVKSGGIIFSLVIAAVLFHQGITNKLLYNEIYRSNLVLPSLIIIITLFFFFDDKYDISKRIRFVAQIIFCFFGLSVLKIPFFEIIPLKVEMFFYVFCWVYLINVSNFLDGIDGYLSTNFLFFLISSIMILNSIDHIHHSTISKDLIFISITLFSFLIFNFPKAKIYMGDSGSVVIGFIVGLVFLKLLEYGFYIELLFLYNFFILDVTITLIERVFIKKVLPWERLFDYNSFYPVIKFGNTHLNTLIISIIYNLLFILNLFFYLKTQIIFLVLVNFCLASLQLLHFRFINFPK